jgi:hypothetical protein
MNDGRNFVHSLNALGGKAAEDYRSPRRRATTGAAADFVGASANNRSLRLVFKAA